MIRTAEPQIPIEGDEGVEEAAPVVTEQYLEYHSSLLAHELGHILMEHQDGVTDFYDHYCPKYHTACPRDNLMTSGGYIDWTDLRAPHFTQPSGYSPLPNLEAEQCELLKNNPLITAK